MYEVVKTEARISEIKVFQGSFLSKKKFEL